MHPEKDRADDFEKDRAHDADRDANRATDGKRPADPAAVPASSETIGTWGTRTVLAAVAVAALIAAGGGAAVYAATGHQGRPGFGQGLGGPGGPGGHGGPPGQGGPGGPGAPRDPAPRAMPADPAALRSETVVSDGHGGYLTLVNQTGRLTAVSATSVSARSDDGFDATYAVNATTPPPFSVGDLVALTGTRRGGVVELTGIRPTG